MKIFGIGLQRTGTTSLAEALRLLGYRSLHTPLKLYENIDHACLRKYDAFTDLPIPLLYKELDQKNPGSKFIGTIRDVEQWLASVKWLFTTGRIEYNWAKNPRIDDIHEALYGTAHYHGDLFRRRYLAYYEDVQRYFEERPDDLLMMDLTRGDGWEKLCPFLNKEIPDVDFPRQNKSSRLRTVKARLIDPLRRFSGH